MREGEDRTGFQGEKQNQPPDPDQCLFAEARLHFRAPQYDNEGALISGEGDGRQQLLLEQIRQFPLEAHDDGPDALEMACQEALVPRIRVTVRQF